MDRVEDQKGYKTVDEKIAGTSTPYTHIGKPGLLKKIRLGIFKIISPINPLARSQVEKHDQFTYPPW